MTTQAWIGRAGGLAAALGAGVVIGLTSSAPASADTTDSPTQAPTASTGPGSAVRRAANPNHADRGAAIRAAASAPARSATAKPATTRSGRLTARIAPAAAGPQAAPVAAAPVTPAASAPAAPVSTAPAAQSLGSLLCDPRGQKIRVFKGTHVALPLNAAFFTRKVTGSATFTPDTSYDLGDVDQYDWNKLTGIAFSPLQHDRNSAMVGWRYNLNTEEFEIAPFYNVDKKRVLPNELTEVISVPADQAFTYTVDYDGITVSYGDKTVYKPYPEGLKPIQLTASRVSGWFGGNEVAPRTISYYLKLKRL